MQILSGQKGGNAQLEEMKRLMIREAALLLGWRAGTRQKEQSVMAFFSDHDLITDWKIPLINSRHRPYWLAPLVGHGYIGPEILN